MSTVRPGHRSVLVVVDVQVGVMAEAWDAQRVIANVAHAVESARTAGVPVIWVQHEAADLPRDSAAWQWVDALQPAEGEVRIHKRFESSFEETALEAHLARLGATRIVLAGASTNWCIRATAYAALDRGYDLTLVADAHTTSSLDLGQGSRIEAAGIVAELNVVMSWLNYPGRRCGTSAVAKLDWAVPDAQG